MATLEREPRVLLLDADGNLFGSEEPAFAASAEVTNRFLATIGVPARYGAEELRRQAAGRNFRNLASALAAQHGREPGDLDAWVQTEKDAVSAHLGRVLGPDPAVREPLARLAERYELAVVSSSALSRLDVCFRATALDALLPGERRFSAEDSLPRPASKPDPAVYRHALEQLGCEAGESLAVEDAVAGVASAAAAGIPVVGNLQFVGDDDPAERSEALIAAGACAVVASWAELEDVLGRVRTRTAAL